MGRSEGTEGLAVALHSTEKHLSGGAGKRDWVPILGLCYAGYYLCVKPSKHKVFNQLGGAHNYSYTLLLCYSPNAQHNLPGEGPPQSSLLTALKLSRAVQAYRFKKKTKQLDTIVNLALMEFLHSHSRSGDGAAY